MKRIVLLFALIILALFTNAQVNLIANGSFENFIPPCPTGAPNGAFNQVVTGNPHNRFRDLVYHMQNCFAARPTMAAAFPGPPPNLGSNGIAYVGFHTRIFSPPYNESIVQLLKTPLIAGDSYTISFDLMDCQSGFL